MSMDCILKHFKHLNHSTVEKRFEVREPNVYGPQQPTLGLELVGALDGIKAMGESEHDR